MAKDFPCPCCCKHVEVPDITWVKGGITKCHACGYNIKFAAHPPVLAETTPDDIMLRKVTKEVAERPLTKEEIDAIFPKRETNPLIIAKQKYDSLNPRPLIEFTRGPEGKPSVMIGLKFDF